MLYVHSLVYERELSKNDYLKPLLIIIKSLKKIIKKIIIIIIIITVPIEGKEKEKLENYQDLRGEVAWLWLVTVTGMHLVVGALGMMMKNLQGNLQQIRVSVRMEFLQKAALFGVLGKVLECFTLILFICIYIFKFAFTFVFLYICIKITL